MNENAYAHIYRTEIENSLLKDQLNTRVEEITKRNKFVTVNRRFNRH